MYCNRSARGLSHRRRDRGEGNNNKMMTHPVEIGYTVRRMIFFSPNNMVKKNKKFQNAE